ANNQVELGDIQQNTTTAGNGSARNWGEIGTSGNQPGAGGSFSITATNAISSVSSTNINNTGVITTSMGNITQETRAGATTTNRGRFNLSTNADFSGAGISASISATAAASVVSSTSIGGTGSVASF